MELAPAPPLAGNGEIGEQGDSDDDQREQALGEHGERQQGVYGVPTPARAGTGQGGDQAIERGGDEEAENCLRDEHAGEEESIRRWWR